MDTKRVRLPKRYLAHFVALQLTPVRCRWEPVLFMMPMRGALTLGATAQDLVEALVVQLSEMKVSLVHLAQPFGVWLFTVSRQIFVQASWKKPEQWRLLFHCFSNTGWYTFGAVMEGLLKHAATLLQHVIGSVVDSAPHAEVSHAGISIF